MNGTLPEFSLTNGALPPQWRESLSGKKVFLSFSGGPDSCALFLLLARWQKEEDFTLEAVHFHHHLRGEEADRDALFAEEFAKARTIPFQLIHLHIPAERLAGEGEEEAARRLRLAKWREILREEKNAVIALGHQKEDVLENFFLRLARGGNVSSLTALRSFVQLGELCFFRPLLAFSKEELQRFLQQEGVKKWCLDRTNLDETYCRRNFFRNQLFPQWEKAIPNFSKGVEKSLSVMALDAAFLEETAEKAFEALSPTPHVEEFRKLPPAIAFRVLRLFLIRELGEKGGLHPDHNSWQRFCLAAEKARFHAPGRENFYRIPLPGIPEKDLAILRGHLALLPKEDLLPMPELPLLTLTEEELREGEKVEKTFGEFLLTFQLLPPGEQEVLEEEAKEGSGKKTAFFDMEVLSFPLQISPRKEGEKMIPFGRKSPVPLKKLFCEGKISPFDRKNHPVLRDAEGVVLMLPLLRRSACAPLVPGGKRILKFSCRQLASKDE